jgi:2,5-diketo-D-gluconate reductase A
MQMNGGTDGMEEIGADSVTVGGGPAGSDARNNGVELLPALHTSRRSVISGAIASGALWRADSAIAAAGKGTGEWRMARTMGETVISGGDLPLNVALGMGPPYAQRYTELAIDAGYRLFDTAQEYGSEEGLGNALKAAFLNEQMNRMDVFVTTKVDIDNMGYDRTIKSVRESFDKLGRLDGGIDLVLIHWPCPFVPKDEPGAIKTNSKLRKETWQALEKLQQDGIVKQIGVSNFGERHLKELLGYAKVRPAVDQVEIHPYNQRLGLEKLVKSEGIRFEAYSPLGKGRIGLFEDPVLLGIAAKKKKSVSQVILRWLLQRGITPIALSRNEKRQAENLAVFDFALTDDEMRAIAKLDRGQFVIQDDEELA